MQVARYFSKNYDKARRKFFAACEVSSTPVERYVNPIAGPDGIELSADVARIGPMSASRLLIMVSGTHGPEFFCGSGCQIGWILEGGGLRLPLDTAVLLVHGINPYGAAWIRRETEDNIDLNRNFLDHSKPHPENAEYAALHDHLLLQDLEGEKRRQSDAALASFRAAQGEIVYMRGLSSGQYSHPDGLYYGGRKSAWSNVTTHAILAKHAAQAKKVALIDYHTGYGPFGYGTLMSMEKGGAALARARRWFGHSLMAPFADAGEQLFTVSGHTYGGYVAALPGAQVTAICLEYGTFDLERDVRVHRQENWLWRSGRTEPSLVRRIKEEFLSQFYPDTLDWKEMIFMRSQQVIGQALNGLAEDDGSVDASV
ncbi:MAG: DUF2817 domain-containing protein [Proteobacteria bacterium]|jgi:hypothetical protein|nr:MAG: DUF2817 domain-containing protein [Pseudomonadota bacterium]